MDKKDHLTLQELKEREPRTQPKRMYKLSHQWLLVYFGVVAALVIAFAVLMSIDEKRYLGAGLALLGAFVAVTAAYLTAMVIVRKKELDDPERKAGAKRPAGLKLSQKKYQAIRNRTSHNIAEKGWWDAVRLFLNDYLVNGDLQPATVVTVDPFVVAAYNDEMDGTVLLSFPNWLAETYGLAPGDRLVTVNAYYAEAFAHHGLQKDIFPGPMQTGKWKDVCPIVALFFAEPDDAVKAKAETLDEALWTRAEQRIRTHCADFPTFVRDGFWYSRPLSTDDWDRHIIADANL